ncbi:MAG: M14 family zinc carboxypeptidase [Acidobacteriota bacterium]
MNRSTGRAAQAGVLMLLLLGPGKAHGQVLLRDEFDGTALDQAVWSIPTGDESFFGRTQIRSPLQPPEVAGGAIHLRLDTHNDTAQIPGDSFLGSEIDTISRFTRGTGLAVAARARLVPPIPGGLVGSLFGFGLEPGTVRDEIDFELLTNDVTAGRQRVLSNVFNNEPFTVPGDAAFLPAPGLDLLSFNVFEIRWWPDRVEWWVNGSRLRTEADTVPGGPLSVRLNLWAPGTEFPDAFDISLQPTASPGENRTFFYDVDWVEVRRLPDPPAVPTLGLLAATGLALGLGLVLLGRLHRRARLLMALVGLAWIPTVTGAATPLPLDHLVQGILWPRTPEEARAARETLASDPTLGEVSRARFLNFEEVLRRGPSPARFPASQPALLRTLEVTTPEGAIPVLLRLPTRYRPDRAWPLLLAMHGGPPRTKGQALAGARRMIAVWAGPAEAAGWIVAAPAMVTTLSVDAATSERLPYEIFHPEQARAVLEEVQRQVHLDPDRIVATGISLGSNFSIAFAAAHPDWFAALVPVSTEGDSRERLARDLAMVPAYILEGSLDSNIREIAGPRALNRLLTDLGAEVVYREFPGRGHEGYQSHYGDVLRWLDHHPRRVYPEAVQRVPHAGIVPLARRIHWIESDTRQGLVQARAATPHRIEITAWRTRRLKVFLHDRLVDLDRPVTITVNGETVFSGQVKRSIRTALEQARRLDPGRIYAAMVEVEVPRTAAATAAGRRLARDLQPSHPEGRLSYWEMFARRALEERFPDPGFRGTEEPLPGGWKGALPDQVAIRVDEVDPGSGVAAAGLRPGDHLIEVDGEPFFAGGGTAALHQWLARELRGIPATYPLRIVGSGPPRTLEARLRLGPYAHRSGPAPEALARRLITFDHYHGLDEIETYLQAVTLRHPRLSRLVTFGTSRGGRPLWAMEICRFETGPAEDKPGFYLDGNIHGGEVLGGEGALAFIDRLLEGYGTDREVTSLVDRFAFYVVPIVNPDGRAISVETPENHRWNIRPVDEDGDGRVDEDPPEDLDGDGRILRIRVRDPDGEWTVSPADPRLMVKRTAGDTTAAAFRLLTEGIDNDGDGRFNEDGVGGVDLNRNFPANWHPGQYASGPYPLSEPETRALVDYITARPNIAAIHTYHTSGGLLLRFPTLADQAWDFPRSDLEDYHAIADAGVPLTGYENYAYKKKKIVDLMHPGHGVFNDWGSSVFGVLAMTTEMWKHAIDGNEQELLAWNDDLLHGRGFIPWYPFAHPQLGRVEMGGWNRWSLASPPEALMADELERNTRWVVEFARRLPHLELVEAGARPVDRRPGEFRIQAAVANLGWMPTATAYAAGVLGTAQPVTVHLSLIGARLIEGEPAVSLGILPGSREDGPDIQRLAWRVRILPLPAGGDPSAEIVVASRKAGTIRRRLALHAAARSSSSSRGRRMR